MRAGAMLLLGGLARLVLGAGLVALTFFLAIITDLLLLGPRLMINGFSMLGRVVRLATRPPSP